MEALTTQQLSVLTDTRDDLEVDTEVYEQEEVELEHAVSLTSAGHHTDATADAWMTIWYRPIMVPAQNKEILLWRLLIHLFLSSLSFSKSSLTSNIFSYLSAPPPICFSTTLFLCCFSFPPSI